MSDNACEHGDDYELWIGPDANRKHIICYSCDTRFVPSDVLEEALRYVETMKAETFSDAKTWRSSGAEYETSAKQQEQGWDKAVAAFRARIDALLKTQI